MYIHPLSIPTYVPNIELMIKDEVSIYGSRFPVGLDSEFPWNTDALSVVLPLAIKATHLVLKYGLTESLFYDFLLFILIYVSRTAGTCARRARGRENFLLTIRVLEMLLCFQVYQSFVRSAKTAMRNGSIGALPLY